MVDEATVNGTQVTEHWAFWQNGAGLKELCLVGFRQLLTTEKTSVLKFPLGKGMMESSSSD